MRTKQLSQSGIRIVFSLVIICAIGGVFFEYTQPTLSARPEPVAAPFAGFVVTNTLDADSSPGVCDAQCTLRDAVSAADAVVSDDVITFAIPPADPGCSGGVCTITLTGALGEIPLGAGSGALTITGTGANTLTVDAGTAPRAFTASGNVTLTDLRITGGSAAASGGGAMSIGFNGTVVTVDRVHFDANTAVGGQGGAVAVSLGATATIRNSTFSGNQAAFGGAVSNSGATLNLYNSTFSNNQATSDGGALRSQDAGTTTTVRNATMTLNRAATAGTGGVSASGCTLGNSIVAGNTNIAGDTPSDGAGGCTDSGGNFLTGNPMLDPLVNYGGTTPTHQLQAASPAKDAGTNALIPAGITTDQRGGTFARIFNTTVDIGAFEVQPGGATCNAGDLDASFVGSGDPTVAGGASRVFFGANSDATEDNVESFGFQTVGANAGKIIAVGTTQTLAPNNQNEGVVRLGTNGAVDMSFAGGAGKVSTEYAGSTLNRGTDVAVDPTNDKIVVVGFANFPDVPMGMSCGGNVNNDITVSMYTADGVLDNNFDFDGRKTINFYDCNDVGNAVVIQPDHKIVIVGEALKFVGGIFEVYFTLTRLNPDGTPDPTFNDGIIANTSGTIQILNSTGDLGSGIDIALITAGPQAGKFIVVGAGNSFSDGLIARFKSDGGLDDDAGTGFGPADTGFVDIPFPSGALDLFTSVALQPDGKIVAAGTAGFFSSPQDFAIARTSEDGVLDSSFDGDMVMGVDPPGNGNGIVRVDLLPAISGASASADAGERVDIASDGKIIVSGSAAGDNAPNNHVAIVRLNTDGTRDTAFSGDGRVATKLSGTTVQSPMAKAGTMQPDGKILTAGGIAAQTGGGPADMFAARFCDGSVGPPPTPPTVSVNDSSAGEGSNVVFTVSLDHTTFQDVVVTYNTTTGTATGDVDYNQQNSNATVTIPAGMTTADVNIPTFQDVFCEGSEAFNFNIVIATGGTVADNLGLGTITDDESATTTTVASSQNPSTFGQPVTFTATVAPIPAGGTVQFVIDGNPAGGPVAVNGAGLAMLMTSTLPAGNHTVVANYSGTVGSCGSSGTLAGGQTVNQAPQVITFAPLANKTYGDAPFTVSASGGASGNPVTFAATNGQCTSSGVDGSLITITGAGFCTVTASQAGNANYLAAAPVSRSFLIFKAVLNVNAVAASKSYGAFDPTLTATLSGFKNGENFASAFVMGNASCTRTAGETVAGSPYTITCTPGTLNAANYTFAAGTTASFTINKAVLNVDAVAASKSYGAADPAFTYTLSGFQNGENAATAGVTGSASCTRAGGETVAGSPYTITCAPNTLAAANYTFATGATAAFTISKAVLNVNAVAASKSYGAADPTLTGTLSGFQNGENATTAGVTGSASCTRTAGETVAGSPYTITCAPNTLAAANYSFATGTTAAFTINKAVLNVNAVAATKIFGTNDPALTATLSGFQNGENAATAFVTGTAGCTRAAGETVLGSPYTITCAPGTLVAANYSFANGTTANFTITIAASTTTITNALALAGQTIVNQTYAVNWSVVAVLPSTGSPTGGTVTVSDGTGATCQAAVALGTCSLTGLTPGLKLITATYSGDSNMTGSTSAAVTHTVVISVAGNIKQYIAFGTNTNLAGVTVTLSGAENLQTVTDASGNFSFGVLVPGNYTITPGGLGKTYEPTSRTFTNVTTNIVNPTFLAYDVPGPNANPRSTRIVSQTATAGTPVTVPFLLSSALGNETKVSFTAHYTVGVLGIPTVTCGADAPGCTVVVNNSLPGKVGVTITPVGAITPGVREVAKITFPTSPTAVASTPILFGDFPTTRLVTDAGNNPLPVLYWTNGVVAFNPTTLVEGATLTGRVLTSNGQGIRNAIVVLTDREGNHRTATTTSFGTYTFTGLELGGDYTITVTSKRYRFAPRTINVTDNLTGVDLVGLE